MNNDYTANISNICIDNKLYGTFLKFDTGANRSVITTGCFTKSLKDSPDDVKYIQSLESKIIESGIKGIEFTSATNDKFNGYPCEVEYAQINGKQFEKFYFYLVFKDFEKSLLGYDFINYCLFTKPITLSVYIRRLNYNSYVKNFFEINNNKVFSLKTLTLSETYKEFETNNNYSISDKSILSLNSYNVFALENARLFINKNLSDDIIVSNLEYIHDISVEEARVYLDTAKYEMEGK